LPNELNYESLAWKNVQPVKIIVDEYIKIFFENIYSLIKFIITELLVIPILLFLTFILYKSKNKEIEFNSKFKNPNNFNQLKPKRRIDIFKRNMRVLFKKNSCRSNGVNNSKLLKNNKNSDSSVAYKKKRRRIDIARKNFKNLFRSYQLKKNNKLNLSINNLAIKNNNAIEIDESDKTLNSKLINKKMRRIDIARKNLRNLIKNGILK
jgi:hypothetical protein